MSVSADLSVRILPTGRAEWPRLLRSAACLRVLAVGGRRDARGRPCDRRIQSTFLHRSRRLGRYDVPPNGTSRTHAWRPGDALLGHQDWRAQRLSGPSAARSTGRSSLRRNPTMVGAPSQLSSLDNSGARRRSDVEVMPTGPTSRALLSHHRHQDFTARWAGDVDRIATAGDDGHVASVSFIRSLEANP